MSHALMTTFQHRGSPLGLAAGRCTTTTIASPVVARASSAAAAAAGGAARWRRAPRLRPVCGAAPPDACVAVETRPAGAPTAPQSESANKSQEYTLRMRDAMGWGDDKKFEYSLERGLYFHEVMPGLFCGSQPRHAADVDDLKALGATAILSLQQDKDMHHWGVKPEVIRDRCSQLGIKHIRHPVQDFDPHSLRKVLPAAVQSLHEAYSKGERVYVHCTAGLGRAPGVIIAYLYWFYEFETLRAAYDFLTSIRPCGPKAEAIRGATHDIHFPNHLDNLKRMPVDAFTRLGPHERRMVMSKVTQGHFHRYH